MTSVNERSELETSIAKCVKVLGSRETRVALDAVCQAFLTGVRLEVIIKFIETAELAKLQELMRGTHELSD